MIQGCNPPDLIFLLALWYRLRGVRYFFDHHDVCPELFEAKFDKRGLLYRIMLIWERMTFATASVSIATNESFRAIASRGARWRPRMCSLCGRPPASRYIPAGPGDRLSKGAETVLGYVGVIGQQEGMDLLVQAADHLIRKLGHTSVHFAIVGFGPQVPLVQADVAAHGLAALFHLHRPALWRCPAVGPEHRRYRVSPDRRTR